MRLPIASLIPRSSSMMITVGWLVGAVGILAEFPGGSDHMVDSL
jgi:hypothetical protein